MARLKELTTPTTFALCLLAGLGVACSKSHPRISTETAGKPGSLLLLDGLEQPLAGYQLLVAGEVVTTDADGRAPLPELDAEYDVALRGGSIYVYQGLSSRAPVIRLPYEAVSAETRHARVDVFTTLDEDPRLAVLQDLKAPGLKAMTAGFNSDGEGHYWVFLDWVGPEEATLTLEAFTVAHDPETDEVTQYASYARHELSIKSGASVEWTPEFGAVPFRESAIRASVELPPDQNRFGYVIYVRTKTGGGGWLSAGAAENNGRLLVPDLPGVTFDLFLDGWSENGETRTRANGLKAGDEVEVTLIPAPRSLVSTDDAEAACPDEFSWTPVAGALYYLQLNSGENGPSFQIISASPRVTLPDLSALGVPPPTGKYTFWPNAVGDYASLDAYAQAPEEVRWGSGQQSQCRFGPTLRP